MTKVARTRPSSLMPRGTTLIAVVMDRSASMEPCREEMRAAFAEFIAGQRTAPGACAVSLYQFDDQFEAVYQALPLEAVPPLVLEPRGGTALHDAVAKAIITVRRDADPDHVIMVIITDGAENSSKEYEGEQGARKITGMISRRQAADGWEFIYLGAGLQGIASAAGGRALPFGSPAAAMSSAGELALRERTAQDW